MTDISKIKAKGPWILIKVDKPPEKTEGGIYMPAGNAEERFGNATGIALSVGEGKLNEGKKAIRAKYTHSGIKEGDRVVFRGFLQEANRPGPMDKDHALIHMDDIIGVQE